MRVFYICTGNSFRSPVAEALTRKYHPTFEVESAGTHAIDHIANDAERLLEREDARKYVKPHPDHISQRAIDQADLIVVFERMHKDHLLGHFKVSPKKIINWDIEDPIKPNISPNDAFARIKKKVRALNEKRGVK
jgi:protein-tyrosine-phosphatase